MSLRDIRQQEFADKWLQSKFGILHLCPRFGKIKTSINALNKLGANLDKIPSVLIIHPIETIKASWEADLEKWGYNPAVIHYTTTASLWKMVEKAENGLLYDLIIADEIHMFSPANLEELNKLKELGCKNILGLSGTISDKTEREIKAATGLPIVGWYDIETGIREKVITDYEIYVLLTDLDSVTRYVRPAKLKNFTVTEADRYRFLTNRMEEIKIQYWHKKEVWENKLMQIPENDLEAREKHQESKPNLSDDYGFLPIQRMNLFKKSLAKLNVTKRLIAKAKEQNKRAIIFCGLTEIADQLGVPVYHSKKKDIKVKEDFLEGKGLILATVDMFEAGVTVKPINLAIINSHDSNPENLGQRISRLTGFEYDNPGKVAKVYIVCTNTVELEWLDKALEFFDLSKVKYYNANSI